MIPSRSAETISCRNCLDEFEGWGDRREPQQLTGVPFADGNRRVGRLLTLFLLYQCDFGVGRYISLERIVEQSRETYYEALYRSSQHWHEGRHNLRPWVEYFLGVLIAAHNDFEARVGTISSAKGAKRELVKNAVAHLLPRFTVGELA